MMFFSAISPSHSFMPFIKDPHVLLILATTISAVALTLLTNSWLIAAASALLAGAFALYQRSELLDSRACLQQQQTASEPTVIINAGGFNYQKEINDLRSQLAEKTEMIRSQEDLVKKVSEAIKRSTKTIEEQGNQIRDLQNQLAHVPDGAASS